MRVIDFDFRRSSSRPLQEAQSAWALARILEAEDANVVHLVAMKPVVLGGLALKLVPKCHVVVHMTGLGLLGFGTGRLLRIYRAAALRLMASTLRKPTSTPSPRTPTIWRCCARAVSIPDPASPSWAAPASTLEAFPALPQPRNDVPVAAFVGRMIRPKGWPRADAGPRPPAEARRPPAARALRRHGCGQPRGGLGRGIESLVRQARCALARPCHRRARGVAARRHLRPAGAQS